jgi:hypothetical protein
MDSARLPSLPSHPSRALPLRCLVKGRRAREGVLGRTRGGKNINRKHTFVCHRLYQLGHLCNAL